MKDIITIGIDLGDKKNYVFVLDGSGKKIDDFKLDNTLKGIEKLSSMYPSIKSEVVIETGTHSRWVSTALRDQGFKVYVADARQVSLISKSQKKNDRRDAEMLARLGRVDKKLLKPVHHRSEQAQLDLSFIKSRDSLVSVRTSLVNYVRGILKSFGYRLKSCSTDSFHKQDLSGINDILQESIKPVIKQISLLTKEIKSYDKIINKLKDDKYSETSYVEQIKGVGPITALSFVLMLEDPKRFNKSRDVGSYLGLTPRQDQSGNSDKQLRITKAGNTYLRQLLISCAHYILGSFGEDCDLRNHGQKIMSRGGKNAKKRAVVAVARKLGVLMHCLWKNQLVYDPLFNNKNKQAA